MDPTLTGLSIERKFRHARGLFERPKQRCRAFNFANRYCSWMLSGKFKGGAPQSNRLGLLEALSVVVRKGEADIEPAVVFPFAGNDRIDAERRAGYHCSFPELLWFVATSCTGRRQGACPDACRRGVRDLEVRGERLAGIISGTENLSNDATGHTSAA
jgi:hypothetical protein